MSEQQQLGASQSESQWNKRTARVSLAIRTSWQRAFSATTEHVSDSSEILTESIDQALRSLYTLETTETPWTALQTTNAPATSNLPTPSYVPRMEYDWLLDGLPRADEEETTQLLDELEMGASRRLAGLDEIVKNWEAKHQAAFVTGKGVFDDEVDSFGDFQSAGFENFQQSSEKFEEETARVSLEQQEIVLEAGECITPDEVLIERADRILAQHELPPSTCKSPCTPELLAQSQQLVQKFLQEKAARDPVTPIPIPTAYSVDDGSIGAAGDTSVASPLSHSQPQQPPVGMPESCDEIDTPEHVPPPLSISLPIALDLSTPSDKSSVQFDHIHCMHQRGLAVEQMAPVPLSLRLPMTDLSTREARHMRRRQRAYRKEQKSSVLGLEKINLPPDEMEVELTPVEELQLPSYVFNSNVDVGLQVLQNVPWRLVLDDSELQPNAALHPSVDNNHDEEPTDFLLWDEYMTQQLSDLDGSLQDLQKHLLQQVQPHVDELQRANGLLRDLEQNVRLGEVYYQRSWASLQVAKGDPKEAAGLEGFIVLQEAWDLKTNYYQTLQALLGHLNHTQQQLELLVKGIESFTLLRKDYRQEYQRLADLALELQQTVMEKPLVEVDCWVQHRVRLGNIATLFWDRLLSLCQSCGARQCRRTLDWANYESLLQMSRDVVSRFGGGQMSSIGDYGQWVDHLVSALEFEAERAFAVALAEPFQYEDSEYSVEIDKLALEVDLDWGDRAKLRSLVHNLVTIRFDFESAKMYLPRVLKRLCENLVGVLNVLEDFVEWHQQHPVSESSFSFHRTLQNSRRTLWDCCEGVLSFCLDEYMNFACRTNMFEGGNDDLWLRDLYVVRSVHVLVEGFLALQHTFYSDTEQSEEGNHDDRDRADMARPISDKVARVCRRHLQRVHVQAMNTLGRKLSGDSWVLVPFAANDQQANGLFWAALKPTLVSFCQRFSDLLANEHSQTEIVEQRWSFQYDTSHSELLSCLERFPLSAASRVEGILERLVKANSGDVRLAPQAVATDVVDWFSRIFLIMKLLPPIVEDASAVFANLCDLYVTTAFRICAGNGSRERYLLGIARPHSPLLDSELLSSLKPKHSSALAMNRSGSHFRHSRRGALPPTLDAEICAPLLEHEKAVQELRKFIVRAQDSLKSFVSLDMVDSWVREPNTDTLEEEACEAARCLEKRLAAATSVSAVAGILETLHNLTHELFRDDDNGSALIDCLSSLSGYVSALVGVTPTLLSVATTISTQRAISCIPIIEEIVGNGSTWEESKMNEEPNEYVDGLFEKCALIWGFLNASGKLPSGMLAEAWGGLLTASYLSLLEGFSRIPYCSTEGRALMAIDLAFFSSEVRPSSVEARLAEQGLVGKPPSVDLKRGMRYVDAYIKVFYFPDEEKVNWIRQNYQRYQLNHVLVLMVPSAVEGTLENAVSFMQDIAGMYKANEV